MYIEKKLKLRNNVYFVRVEVEYKKCQKNNNIPDLYIKNYKDDYFDGGNFSKLIKLVEENYTKEKSDYYDENISYMADILYIYDRVPFLCGIRDEYISSIDNLPYSIGYISKEEIEKYIIDNNIKMNNNPNFKLSNEFTWDV